MAEVLTVSRVACAAPAVASAGEVSLQLVLESGTLEGEAVYEYLEASKIAALMPSRGSVTGGTMVSVTGSGFREAGLRCRFGGEEVLGGEAFTSVVDTMNSFFAEILLDWRIA